MYCNLVVYLYKEFCKIVCFSKDNFVLCYRILYCNKEMVKYLKEVRSKNGRDKKDNSYFVCKEKDLILVKDDKVEIFQKVGEVGSGSNVIIEELVLFMSFIVNLELDEMFDEELQLVEGN